MREYTICAECKGKDIEYLGGDRCYCNTCCKETDTIDRYAETPYERTCRAVYSTGNKWTIENFNATH